MSQDKKTPKIKALIFSVLRAKTQNLQTFSIFPELELTFESLGTSLINLFGKLAPAKIREEFKDFDIGPKSLVPSHYLQCILVFLATVEI